MTWTNVAKFCYFEYVTLLSLSLSLSLSIFCVRPCFTTDFCLQSFRPFLSSFRSKFSPRWPRTCASTRTRTPTRRAARAASGWPPPTRTTCCQLPTVRLPSVPSLRPPWSIRCEGLVSVSSRGRRVAVCIAFSSFQRTRPSAAVSFTVCL